MGESWELYDFPPGVVEGSTRLGQRRGRERPAGGADAPLAGGGVRARRCTGDVPLVGEQGQFPILIKFLDAQEDLSVQVHPAAALLRRTTRARTSRARRGTCCSTTRASRILKGLKGGVIARDVRAGDRRRHGRAA